MWCLHNTLFPRRSCENHESIMIIICQISWERARASRFRTIGGEATDLRMRRARPFSDFRAPATTAPRSCFVFLPAKHRVATCGMAGKEDRPLCLWNIHPKRGALTFFFRCVFSFSSRDRSATAKTDRISRDLRRMDDHGSAVDATWTRVRKGLSNFNPQISVMYIRNCAVPGSLDR